MERVGRDEKRDVRLGLGSYNLDSGLDLRSTLWCLQVACF